MIPSGALDLLLPDPPPPGDSWRWGTVTGVSPLRVRLDGDGTALAVTPDSLVPISATGGRVLCQILGRRVIVHGGANPVAPVEAFLGQVVNDSDIGPLPTANTDYLVPGKVTFTLVEPTRVWVRGRLRFWASAAGQIGYLKTMLVAGSTATLTGATIQAAPSQILTPAGPTTSATGITAAHDYTQSLTAGTYTAFLAAGSTTSGACSVGQMFLEAERV